MATFLKNINLVSRASTQFLDERVGGDKFKGYHCKYLLTVCNNRGLSQDAIAKLMFVNKSNVTRQLAYLEKEGYIERRKSDSDGRVYLVYPTPKAEEILPEIRKANAEWRATITGGFSPEEVEMLAAFCERLIENAKSFLGDRN